MTALVLTVAGCDAEPARFILDVSGEHRFLVGDDPRFSALDFDDSEWNTVALPATWRVRTPGADAIAWHRFHFESVGPRSSGPLAIDLGAIFWSDEVFLNGQRIGATGSFDRIPRLGRWPRLYAVPDGSLRSGRNVLAIRVRGIPMSLSGLPADRIGIGDAVELERARARDVAKTQIAEGLLFGFLGLSWLLVAFFPKRGQPGGATLFLLASISLALVLLWLISVTARHTHIDPNARAPVVIAVLLLAGSSYWAFVARIVRGFVPRLVRRLVAAEAVLAVGFVVWSDAYAVLIVAAVVIGTVGGCVVGWLLVGAIRARTPGAIPIAVGSGLAAASVPPMLFAPMPFLFGLPVVFYGLVSAIALGVLALIRHVHDMNHQIQRATMYSLDAHTRERSRLARDLHDGLGQMLALLKLQMQRMARKHEGELVQKTFDESAEQVTATLDELHRIARDLRPAPMEDRGFGEAVREYAAAMARRTDLTIEVEGDYDDMLRDGVGDELYRIAQECLTNCLKHSRAHRVVVTLAHSVDQFRLIVADDGCGIEADAGEGLGLSTIRERAELLGGTCTITQPSQGGTRVEVCVPRDVVPRPRSPST